MRHLNKKANSETNRVANREGYRLSNPALMAVIAVLGTGILLDGILYLSLIHI